MKSVQIYDVQQRGETYYLQQIALVMANNPKINLFSTAQTDKEIQASCGKLRTFLQRIPLN